ncbi:cache domain-containing protein [Halarcobacter sp.]|uniref:sensor histidine kinase n=1 Tax=Halarcobacter sp. TaxID=2321133 RepID=UPI002AAB3A1A|nr:cache domain-containing protein [Halarcobacter sp.]
MLIKSEKNLLDFIKYSPVVIIILIALLVNALIYFQNLKNFEKDMEIYKKNYIETNKEIIKLHVEKVFSLIEEQKENLEEQVKKDLKDRVNEAYAIIENIYNKNPNTKKETVLTQIKEALRPIRFNEGRGYFYINNLDGNIVLHPINPNFENTNIYNRNQNETIKSIISSLETLKNKKETFNNLFWYKPNETKIKYEKITFNKVFRPLNIVVGTGEYLNNIRNNIKKEILQYIQNITYGDNGYVLVFDYDGYQLAHIKKEYIGKNRINLTDANGTKITQSIIDKAKEGKGFISYIGTIMPSTGKPSEKITYVRGLQNWEWAIASGFYTKDMMNYLEKKEKELKQINNKSFRKILLISIILSIVLILLASYVSNRLRIFFNTYKKRIKEEIQANRKKDEMLYQQSKMASMGEMIGNIAHQWRQPLNLISTAASGIKLEEDLNILTKESQKNSLDSILRATQYLSKTIDDFREFFNPNKKQSLVSTKSIYERTTDLINVRIQNHNIHIESNVEEFVIYTYENELNQALINILNNSIDALSALNDRKRTIFFTIKHFDKSKIKKRLNPFKIDNTKEYLLIEIKDNANGIKEEIKDKIFDAYFTTKHQAQGTGIGLYMTYQIITNHLNGDIHVDNTNIPFENESFKGAKFTILLPIKDIVN